MAQERRWRSRITESNVTPAIPNPAAGHLMNAKNEASAPSPPTEATIGPAQHAAHAATATANVVARDRG